MLAPLKASELCKGLHSLCFGFCFFTFLDLNSFCEAVLQGLTTLEKTKLFF